MLEAVPHKPALAGAFAVTAVVSAAGGALAAARVARWAARLAPDEVGVLEIGQDHAPRVVVPLVKPGHEPQERHGLQQATSGYDVGDTMHQMRGAVKA